jgi:hypothetical protein
MTANLIIGSSHALYFSEAVGAHTATWKDASDLVPIGSGEGAQNFLIYTTNRPSFIELSRAADGQAVGRFGPLLKKIRRFDRKGAKVVFGIGGNEHNLRFMRAHPKAFDFVHPDHPGVEPGRQILPIAVMRELMAQLLERTFMVTRLIAAELPRAEHYYLPPPPPIPSEAQIRSSPEVFDFSTYAVEHPAVRLKLYALYLEAAQAFCRETGLTYLPPPSEHRDAKGFLAEPFWYGTTHATPDYYRGIVSQLGLTSDAHASL